jgi:diaminopimelate epimerase
MRLDFFKIQATGNDFILFDYKDLPLSFLNADNIQKLCDHRLGIGADGLIALEQNDQSAFVFHYYNSDGSRGEMCANGCRAAINFAFNMGWVEKNQSFTFLADDGEHYGKYFSENTIELNVRTTEEIKKIRIEKFNPPAWVEHGFYINTGVPHVVFICHPKFKDQPIEEFGKYIRGHDAFSPQGTNVNFVVQKPDGSIFVRTYERGVERETLSCGTGITASALIVNSLQKKTADKIKVFTKGGELNVIFNNTQKIISGPAKIVFSGQLRL